MTRSQVLFFFLTSLSWIVLTGLYPELGLDSHLFLSFLVCYSAQFLVFGLWAAAVSKGILFPLTWIWGLAILTRVLVIPTEPILENDFWRYLWDGRVLANGINPFTYLPLDPALDHLDVDYRTKVGFPEYRTIYPPVGQLVFLLNHWTFPDSLLGLKVWLVGFDLGVGVILQLLLLRCKVNPSWLFAYLLNPLVIKEFSNSAHLDSVLIFFSMLSVLLFLHSRILLAWVSLALAIATKWLPLIWVPFFLAMDQKRWKHASIAAAIVVILWLPFVLTAGVNTGHGTQAFARVWIFNAGIFQYVTDFLNFLIRNWFEQTDLLRQAMFEDWPAKFLLGSAFVFWLFRRYLNFDRTDFGFLRCLFASLSWVLVISPVVNGWYVVWILPLAVVFREPAWIVFTFLCYFGYSWFWDQELSFWFRFAEYLIFYPLLILFIWLRRNGSFQPAVLK